ncbi:Vacuolar protein sorting-associated protein 18 like protein [Trifolium repens]|nr:Vacuolar protein sorting-associated protein 18 like protein [Trifolium repens]
MVAHVSDFGIARLVSTICGNSSTIGIKGSVGYAPPEYGMGSEVSTCGDMIGLICSMESPKERMNIVDVTRELNIIRKTFLTGFRTHN